MAEKITETKVSEMKCCPDLGDKPVCDTLNLRYRVPFRPTVGDDARTVVPVEVVLHFRLERCSGELVIGDPVYSTTLMPGEQVRLFTSDRHTRWSYDSESTLAYRHETTSEESFYTAGMAHAMSDLTINESGASLSSYEESWAEGGGGASISIFGLINIGGGGGGGSYDAQSLSMFSRSLSRHAESASMYVAASVRAKSATSIGEVERRTHAESESEAHYESASRTFQNPNKCRAITYVFYKLNKIQKVRFHLVAIERIVQDPAAPAGAYQRTPVDTTGRVAVLPKAIAATAKDRLQVEQMARTSAFERRQAAVSAAGLSGRDFAARSSYVAAAAAVTAPPIDATLRQAAIAEVDKDLAKAGILEEKTKEKPTERILAELSWDREEILPTAGVLVKGCLDDCDTCEPSLQRDIQLELEHKKLENEMLKKQIEILDKSQEYRCCPGQSAEDEEPPA